MLSRNQLILLVITVSTLSLSGYLFYSGFTKETWILKKDYNKTSHEILGEQDQSSVSASPTKVEEGYLVTQVVDGDTIEVLINGEKFKVRYIGIDTPETVDPRRAVGCFGKEASNENKRLVEGKIVTLEKDVSSTDKYGRLLRYVYLKLDDGTSLFINDYLVRQGFGYAYTFPPDIKFNEQFVKAQNEARENRRGLWGRC